MSPKSPAATVISLDHLVLTVRSIPASIEWYTQYLGMRHESFVSAATPDITRHSLVFSNQKINLHESGKVGFHFQSCRSLFYIDSFQEFEPKARNFHPGSADLCFLTSDDISEVRTRILNSGVELVDLGNEKSDNGVVLRTGARGKLRSIYCRDPDDNLIE